MKRFFELATLLRLPNLHVTGTNVSKYERNRSTDIDVRIVEKPYRDVSVCIPLVNHHKLHAVHNLSNIFYALYF
jgi:hypothetical protein